MLLDEFLPTCDFREVHAIRVRATPDRVFDAVKEVTPREIPVFRLLMWLRSLPARLAGQRGPSLAAERPVLEQLMAAGFVLLAEAPERELVVGTIGQFWKLRGGTIAPVRDVQEFVAFDQPDYARAVLNFSLHESRGQLILRTETRIAVADRNTRQKFGAYWRVVMPGSALIRRMWLRAVKKRAEMS